ncbi:hypothetical protein C4A75_00125 [Brevibacillus laterosporus]|nr:hypothetical protein [Brevibacillus laterosporus]PPA87663.1 hypothetical protein C4A75_00125 [Brevibacillus laterosporus]RFB34936.1 hypothetical protein DZB91_10430 [Brevibacillus sp. VP]
MIYIFYGVALIFLSLIICWRLSQQIDDHELNRTEIEIYMLTLATLLAKDGSSVLFNYLKF